MSGAKPGGSFHHERNSPGPSKWFTPKWRELWFRLLLIFYSASKAAWALPQQQQQQQQPPTQVWATYPRPMTGTPSVSLRINTDNKVSSSQQGRTNEKGKRSRRFTVPLQLCHGSFGLIMKLLSDRKIRIPLSLSLSISLSMRLSHGSALRHSAAWKQKWAKR